MLYFDLKIPTPLSYYQLYDSETVVYTQDVWKVPEDLDIFITDLERNILYLH